MSVAERLLIKQLVLVRIDKLVMMIKSNKIPNGY